MHDKPLKPSRWLMQQKKPATVWIWLSILLGLLNILLLIIQVKWLSKIIDGVFIHQLTRADFMHLLLGILVLIIIRSGIVWLKEMAGFEASAKIRHRLRIQLLEMLKTQGPVLSKSKSTGSWISAWMDQVEALHGFYAQYLPQMYLAVLIPLMILWIVFPLNWIAGVILLITAPLMPFFMALVGMGAASINQKNFQALSRMSAHFLDVLQGLTTLKLFGQSKQQAEKIAQVSEDYRKTTMQTLRIAFFSSGVLEFFATCSIALLATYLGLTLLQQIHIGKPIDLYSALVILLLAPEFFAPLRELSTHYHARAQAVAAAEEMMALLPSPPVGKGGAKHRMRGKAKKPLTLETCDFSTSPTGGEVQIILSSLSFQYPNTKNPVLTQFNLTIQPGEHIAITGESGVGKTTILHLLLGFLTPTSGEILLDNKPLAEVGLDDWRQNIAWLSQHPMLFHGTIRDNLLLAKPDATELELTDALEKAYAMEFIARLPKGLDTRVGEQNQGLSGGQAQRIALARAYLKNASILLLDEPTASLDKQSQDWVMQSLLQYAQGKTMILLTHRLDTTIHMDRVIQL